MTERRDGDPRRVLVVDDEELDLTVATEVVARLGFDVSATRDPDEAVRWIMAEPYDIVISDYEMPSLNGLQLLRRARHYLPDSVRIVLTSKRDFDVAVDAINRGEVFRFLNKPLDDRELGMALRIAVTHLEMREEITRLRLALAERDAQRERIDPAGDKR